MSKNQHDIHTNTHTRSHHVNVFVTHIFSVKKEIF